jgi:glyoxylate carboligase
VAFAVCPCGARTSCTAAGGLGVDTVFGLPGDGINGIMEGLRRQQDRVRFFLVHHEEAAAFMATGYAKVTGKLGACLAVDPGPAADLPRVALDTLLDDADSSGVAARPACTAEAGSPGSSRASR